MRPGQEAAGQMGTSVCLQQPGHREDIPHHTPDWTDWLDTLQGGLPVNTPHIMMTWRPISRKCWTLAPARSHTVHGLVQWSWSERRMGAWGSVLTSGNWTITPSRMLICYPALRRQPSGVPVVLFIQPEVRVLASWEGSGEQATDCIYHRAIGILWMWNLSLPNASCSTGRSHILGTLSLPRE